MGSKASSSPLIFRAERSPTPIVRLVQPKSHFCDFPQLLCRQKGHRFGYIRPEASGQSRFIRNSVLPGQDPTLSINPYEYGRVGTLAANQAPISTEGRSYYEIARAGSPFTDVDMRKEARNALIEALITASDHNTSIHLADLKATQSSINVVFGATALGLSGGPPSPDKPPPTSSPP